MNRRRLLLLALIAPIVAACSSSASTSSTAPSPVDKCALQASSSPGRFAAAGGSGTINVETNRECGWSASTSASWIRIQGSADGQGSATLQYRVTENTTPGSRNGVVVIGSTQVSIVQDGATCRFSLDRSAVQISSEGGSINVSLAAMAGCAWSATSRVPWITVERGATGNGNGEVGLLVQPNSSTARQGAVSIADETVTITQQAAAVPPANPSPAPAPSPGPAPSPSPTPSPSPSPSPSPAPSPSPTPAPTPAPAPAPAPAPPPQPSPQPAGERIDLKGNVSGLHGACPNLTFTVSGQRVIADRDTDYKKSECGAVRNGTSVEVKGTTQADGSVRASQIEVNKDKENGDGDGEGGQS